jgi:hypothetical protein
LVGKKSNREAIGARLTITVDGKKKIDEVRAGRGYQSHYGNRIHFGLGESKSIDSIMVRWPSGESEHFQLSGIDQLVVLEQGLGDH